MARFSNIRRLISGRSQPTTINMAGGQAHQISPKRALVSQVTTSMVSDRFYSSATDDLTRLISLVEQLSGSGEAKFAAKAAIYARKHHGLRSISHALAGILARSASGTDWGRQFYADVVHRPDDMCEILAFHWLSHGKEAGVPNAMKRGFAKVLSGLDEYQLAKYKGGKRAVSLVDVVNLCHPKSSPALAALVKGTLAPAHTWETALSAAGKSVEAAEKDELKAEAWKRLLAERKLGYFAALRNARNIAKQAPDLIPQLIDLLTNRRLVQKSLVLPFQIANAIEAVEQAGDIGQRCLIEALHQALDISLDNVPHLPGRTLVALDCSYSMVGRPLDIGALFAAVLLKSHNQADLLIFSDDAKQINISTRGSLYSIAEQIKSRCQPCGTNFHAIFERTRKAYDRIVILSDMQAWIGHYTPAKTHAAYCRRARVEPMIYTWDLSHYGTAQFPADKVCALAGWTDKVFEVMKTFESDPEALINAVEAVPL